MTKHGSRQEAWRRNKAERLRLIHKQEAEGANSEWRRFLKPQSPLSVTHVFQKGRAQSFPKSSDWKPSLQIYQPMGAILILTPTVLQNNQGLIYFVSFETYPEQGRIISFVS